MKWFSSKEALPSDQQEVLVRKKGSVHLAKYEVGSRVFRLRDGSSIPVSTELLEWTELVSPERNR